MICKVCGKDKTNFVYNADRRESTDVCADCGIKRIAPDWEPEEEENG